MSEQPPPAPAAPLEPGFVNPSAMPPWTPGAPTPPPPPKARPRWKTPAIALVSFVVGAGAAGAGTAGDSTSSAKPATTVTVTAQAAAGPAPEASTTTTTEAAPADYVPQPKDFRITLTIVGKECFGSAGCNVKYRIAPKYVGPPTAEGLDLTVTYQVDGGEDGPKINSFTVKDNTASFDQDELISTKSSKSKLSVKVTQVLEN